MLEISHTLVGDSLFASNNFVTGAIALDFNVVSRLRDDAVLFYLYNGPQKGGRGRKKELDGEVDINNLKEDVFERMSVCIDGEDIPLFCAIVKCKSLKRKIKVVVAEFSCGTKIMRKIFFSTDLSMDAAQIFLICHARFQIEYIFRDAKQNTGLEDWQSTDADRLSFGHNASLTAVNVARVLADKIYVEIGRKLSVASVKKVLHNASLYLHIRDFIEGQISTDSQNNIVHSEDIPINLLFFGVRDSA